MHIADLHIDPGVLRAVALATMLLLIVSGRLTKGSSRATPEGLAFGIKPLFAVVRAIALPAYVAFFLYVARAQGRTIPWWMLLLFVAALAIGVVQMPGTIVLAADAVIQRFWIQKDKRIGYHEVMAVQAAQGGRMTRVLGDNRVTITHTSNHSAADEFRTEVERRTGKRLTT